MDEKTKALHRIASRHYGKDSACGRKIDFVSEETATKAATAMAQRHPEKSFDFYPCDWCGGWHVGRALTNREWKFFESLLEDQQVGLERNSES